MGYDVLHSLEDVICITQTSTHCKDCCDLKVACYVCMCVLEVVNLFLYMAGFGRGFLCHYYYYYYYYYV